MKPLGLISQILAIGLSVGIIVFIVQPTFTEIGVTQDEMLQYAQEREKVNQTNQILAQRVSQLESVQPADRIRLSTYMPTVLDEVSILRDIEYITKVAGVKYTDLGYIDEYAEEQSGSPVVVQETDLERYEFAITLESSYTRLKDFLSLLEQNRYPLQVYGLDISAIEGGFLNSEIRIVSYVGGSLNNETN